MGTFRKSLLLLLATLLILSSCQNAEEHLILLIKKHYANYYVNNSSHKQLVLKKLENFLKDHSLTPENSEQISQILNEFNDGHVLLKSTNPKTTNRLSDLTFFPGSFYVSSCEHSCSPGLMKGKYEIVSVGEQGFEKWLEDNAKRMAASTPWGKKYRTSRLLVSNRAQDVLTLKLLNSSGTLFTTQLRFLDEEQPLEKCVEGRRLRDSIYYIKIKTLWCDRGNGDIEENYIRDWDLVTSEVKKTDKIILDLRENNGGDDREVVYTLSSFMNHSFPLYLYQFLTLNRPGKIQRLLHLLPYPFSLWAERGVDMANFKTPPKNTFYDNQVSVLISAGCFSSCEGLASAFKVQKRAKLFGGQTHGGAGNPLFFPIAHSSFSINLPTCLTWQADGQLFEGKGVTPDYLVEDKLEKGDDFVLEEALKF